MKVSEFRSVGALALVGLLVAMSSCAHDQQLVAISVQPTTITFGDATIPVSADRGLAVQLRALGTYIHPPVTKDITNQVTWASDDIQTVTVNSTGLLTATGNACGTGTIVSATIQTNSSAGNRSSSGAIVTGNMTANVVCFTGTGGGGPVLTVTFLGSGSGTVTFTPSSFICANTCSVGFASGTAISITAATGGTFGGWQLCDSVSGTNGTVCNINSLTANRDVTVTFN